MKQAQQMIDDLKPFTEEGELAKVGTSIGVAKDAEEAAMVVRRAGIDFDSQTSEGGDTVFMQDKKLVARYIAKPDGMVVRIDDPKAPGKVVKMIRAQEVVESLLEADRGATFAKKVVDLAPSSSAPGSRTGKFVKADFSASGQEGGRATLWWTDHLAVSFFFEDNSDDLPGAVMVTSVRVMTGRPHFIDKLDKAVNQRQFKRPQEFLAAVAKASS